MHRYGKPAQTKFWDRAQIKTPASSVSTPTKKIISTKQRVIFLALGFVFILRCINILSPPTALAVASSNLSEASQTVKEGLSSFAQKIGVWTFLFVLSAAFSAAEIAITTLYPWKVREFAEEEGPKSPFHILDKDITRVLSTILVTTTFCTIYSAALFTNITSSIFGIKGQVYATLGLTAVTLFFGELLPKSLGVSNAELVARFMVPCITAFAFIMGPIGQLFTAASKITLKLLGFETYDDDKVSEEELRLIIGGAKQSGGIDSEEGKMIEGVLDLQSAKVSEVMCPRVDVVGININSTMTDLLELINDQKFSRIPVYDGEIDRIEGVILSKTILKYVTSPEKLEMVKVHQEMEPTYFVPESMSVWNAFEEMRKRRLHLAVVVDEYGGTAGIVTLEDILEEVVGEIYDEEDDDVELQEKTFIQLFDDGTYRIDGLTDLEDVSTTLNFDVSEEDLRTFGTLSGYLCSQAGQIPQQNSFILLDRYCFTITEADERRIFAVKAELIGQDVLIDTKGLSTSEKDDDEGSHHDEEDDALLAFIAQKPSNDDEMNSQ